MAKKTKLTFKGKLNKAYSEMQSKRFKEKQDKIGAAEKEKKGDCPCGK